MADTPNNLFEKEMALVKMWVDGEVEYMDLPSDVQDALTEVFSEEPTEVSEPVVEEQFVKHEAVQHLDLLHKANDEHRFTLGPWYIPNRYDAHGEWTDANELQSALWDYVKSGDRDIRLQHNKDIVAGEWLEAMSFPVPVTIGMKKASSDEQVVYPAGTVFLGVQWKPWAWDMVKAGKIRGFSIGGAAARVEMAMPDDAIAKASFGGDRSAAGRYAAEQRWKGHAKGDKPTGDEASKRVTDMRQRSQPLMNMIEKFSDKKLLDKAVESLKKRGISNPTLPDDDEVNKQLSDGLKKNFESLMKQAEDAVAASERAVKDGDSATRDEQTKVLQKIKNKFGVLERANLKEEEAKVGIPKEISENNLQTMMYASVGVIYKNAKEFIDQEIKRNKGIPIWKASFGGDRSEAGRYAAHVRWRSKAHSLAQGTANLKAGLERERPKGDKPNIAQRIKDYFTTLPTPYRQEEDRLLREERRANENYVDNTQAEAISLPSGRTAFLSGGKLTTTKFPAGGMTASTGRPLRGSKPKTKPTGKRPKQWLESGYGGAPVRRVVFPKVGKNAGSSGLQNVVDKRIEEFLAKNSPTSSAVHVETIMGGSKKKKKRSKIVVDDVEKASTNVPTDKELYARVKAEAKKKFDVYPSAYANAWLVREYKSRGGKYRIVKASSPAWQREEGKNPKGGLNAKGRASYKRETGGTLKPPVKSGDNPRRASFLARMGNAKGPERDEKGDPTRLLLSLQAWGANSKAEARKKAKAISARNKEKEMEKASFGGDRSQAGRYAANIRWQSKGHVATKYIRQWHRESGRGPFRYPKTKEGKALGRSMPSLQTHCNLDALAEDFKAQGKSVDSIDSPALVYKHLSEERRAVWDAIIKPTIEGVPQGTNPSGSRVFVKAGGGGAGKSTTPQIEGVSIPTTGEKNADGKPTSRDAVLSNADDIKEVLPEWKQAETASDSTTILSPKGKSVAVGPLVERRAAMVHEESSQIASFQVTMALQSGKDIVIDGTMDNGIEKALNKLASYRDNGASEIHMIAYSCDTNEAETRAYRRSRETMRKVPTESLRKAHTKVSENFPTYIEKGNLDSATVIDTNNNDDGSRRPAEKIFEFKPSGGIKILNQALYERFLDKRNDSLKSGIDTTKIDKEDEERNRGGGK